jgi:DMSO/TMAO reductase YedYZ molybdopterin-dependent catalytic subunit
LAPCLRTKRQRARSIRGVGPSWSIGKSSVRYWPKSWSWQEFDALPRTRWTGDIHCVTKWSKFDTAWEGRSGSQPCRGCR